MYNYIEGQIIDHYENTIVIDNNGIGYNIYTANPFVYKQNEKVKIFVYQHINETSNSLYGFKEEEEKELFLKLISVKGLGPKIALPIVGTGSVLGIVDAIERENVLYLKKFPKIGDKLARQIVLDLKGKLKMFDVGEVKQQVDTDDLHSALKGLGYKEAEIKKVVANLDLSTTIEEQIKDALKLLLK